MLGTLIQSFRHLEHQNTFSNGCNNFLVPFLATREAVAPLANDLIMSGTSIRSFRHLEHQNQSIISEDIGRARQRATIPEEESEESDRRHTRIGIQLSCNIGYIQQIR